MNVGDPTLAMADALKSFFSPELVRRPGGDIARIHPTS
jgi:hypothetical protein